MINLYVDPSLLAFPGQVDKEEEDRKNIKRFFHGIDRLYNLACKPQISLLVNKNMERRLRDNGYFYDYFDTGQKERIKNFTLHEPNLDFSPKELSRFYQSFFDDHQVIRFDDDIKETDIQNIPVTDVFKKNSAGLSRAYIEAEHKKLLGYVARLNNEFPFGDNRIVVIAGNSQPGSIDVWLSKDETVPVTLSSAKKTDNTYRDGDISATLPAMYEKANIEFTKEDEIKFGKAVSDHVDSIIWNIDYNTPFLTSKLYYYLKTAFECVLFVRKHHYILPMNDNDPKEEVTKLMVNFGLNSVNDRAKYSRCPFRKWDGRQFTLHLRPTTGNKYAFVDTRDTRVYFNFEYDENQLFIGMICKHPETCGQCGERDTCRVRQDTGVQGSM
jgi:hypothetical protein